MKKSITLKIALMQAAVMLLMGAALSAYNYLSSRDSFIGFYSDKAQQIARFAAARVDGGRLAGYAAAGQPDDYYREVLAFLCDLKKAQDVMYLYVFVPEADRLVYVAEGYVPGEDMGKIASLGEVYMYTGLERAQLVPDVLAKQASDRVILGGDSFFGTTVSAWAPALYKDGRVAVMVEADLSLKKIEGIQHAYLIQAVLMIFGCALLAALSLFIGSFHTVVRPVRRLTAAVAGFARQPDREPPEPGVRSRDELGVLSEAFLHMARKLRLYMEHLTRITAEKERIGAELHVATQIQASMLPCIFPAFPDRAEFDIYATMIPAKEVGGDFYDFFLIDEDRLALVVADVSGKGVPAALFMVIAKTLIKNQLQAGLGPGDAFTNVNRQLCENNSAGMFVTAWLGVWTISSGRFICANAGHNPPLIRRPGGAFEYLRLRPGFVLAGMEEVRYRQYEERLEPGDEIFLYTDGVVEAADAENRLFGEARLKAVLDEFPTGDPASLLHSVRESIWAFAGGAPQNDDITMVALRIAKGGRA